MINKVFYLFVLLFVFSFCSFGQEKNNKNPFHISGTAGLTNNGISLIPNFSLGDPAVLFNLSVSKGDLSFVTDFNFSYEGKPWYILYWLKYQLVDSEKFKMNTGTHLGLNFISAELEIENQPKKFLQYERYWVFDFSPNYMLSENIALGMYYLHSRGLDPGTINASHFLTLNINFSKIEILDDMFLGVNPQVYYLNQDGIDGFYFTSAFTLGKNNFPLTLNSMINQPIKTNITLGNEFVWNLSLIYSFNR